MGGGNSHLLTNNYKISVIIPIFNTEQKLLKRAIDSVLTQTFTDFELILVNDCCTDSTPEILKYYAKADNRVKLINNQQNIGCPQSRKIGLQQAKGDYIIFSDADDFMENTMLAELYAAVVENQADLAYCDYFFYYNSNKECVCQGEFENKILFLKRIMSREIWGIVWNKLAARRLYENLFFPTNFLWEDQVIVNQLISYAQKVQYVAKPLYNYFGHYDEYQTKERRQEAYQNYILIVDFLKKFYQNDICLFEPELSRQVNSRKVELICYNGLTDRKMLFDLYPESHKHILNSKFRPAKSAKLLLFCKVHRLPSFPIYILVKLKKFAVKSLFSY
ncbi:MAG: glycosyltransferase [Prevotellaceae bacterium]|nr:glycosyltransferase [Prevotellaceae bacterium]